MGCVDVLLIEPVRLCASGLRHLLLGSRYIVAEEMHAADSPFVFTDGASPALVIFGPGANAFTNTGIACIQQRAGQCRTSFVALADITDAPLVRRLASSGIDAVLSQDVPGEILLRSLDLVMLGQRLFPPPSFQSHAEALPGTFVAPAPFHALGGHKPPTPRRNQEREVVLSQREGQVLRCLVDGASNKVIARELQITETTVKAHVKGLLRKCRANNRTQVVIWALENKTRHCQLVGLRAC